MSRRRGGDHGREGRPPPPGHYGHGNADSSEEFYDAGSFEDQNPPGGQFHHPYVMQQEQGYGHGPGGAQYSQEGPRHIPGQQQQQQALPHPPHHQPQAMMHHHPQALYGSTQGNEYEYAGWEDELGQGAGDYLSSSHQNLAPQGPGAPGPNPLNVTVWTDGGSNEEMYDSYLRPDAFDSIESTDRNSMQNTNGYQRSRHERPYPGVEARPAAASALDEPRGVEIVKARSRSAMEADKPMTVDEAFRSIKAGVAAEDEGRYGAAMRNFLEAGEMLAAVADTENESHIKTLLHHKAAEVLQWTEALADWIDGGERGVPPKRMGQTVQVNVAGRLTGSRAADTSGVEDPEFTNMTYTAVSTKVVKNFTADGYRLQCVRRGRYPKLMVVITMYNEDEVELNSTLRKVANNTKVLQSHRLPGYEGDDAWKNILVCIVSDGRTKANKGTLNFLKEVGVFDEDAMTINSAGVDVQVHLFEFSTQLMNNKRSWALYGSSDEKGVKYPPMQVVFALKEHNAGKLNSHEWYFNAFSAQVVPEYTVLLDVGTMPTKTAFYRLLTAMEVNKQIGGVCGEIAVDKPIPNLCNFIIAAQHFEYKISNLLDKALESSFGFISVLPGAFSAYRYEAIRGAPLEAYFKSLTTPARELGPFQGNMYLAEDRILCFELLAKKGCNWTMHYVKNAIARTDVPVDLVALIGQRRRWLNGSFFAILYTIFHWGRVYTESSHSLVRKLFFFIQYIFMVVTVVLNWFLVANFFLAVYFVVIVGFVDDSWGISFFPTQDIPEIAKQVTMGVFLGLYGLALVAQIVLGLGNKPKHVSLIYVSTAVFYAIVMAVTIGITALIFYASIVGDGQFEANTVIAAAVVMGVFFVAAALHCELHHIVMSWTQYFLLLPTTVNILTTYSFCNLHDLSWGTKGLESATDHGPKSDSGNKGKYADVVAAQKAAEARAKAAAEEKDLIEKEFNGFRSRLLLFWIVSQVGFIYTVDRLDPSGEIYLATLFYVVAAFNIFRFVGSCAYLAYYGWQRLLICCCVKRKMRKKVKKAGSKTSRNQVAYSEMASPAPVSQVRPISMA